jgi:hypothetical protein
MFAPDGDIKEDKDSRPIARHSALYDLGFMGCHAGFLPPGRFYTNQTPADIWVSRHGHSAPLRSARITKTHRFPPRRRKRTR